MTKGKTKDEIKGAKTQIKNTAQKRLDTYKGNTYGKIQKYRKCFTTGLTILMEMLLYNGPYINND